MKWRILTLTAFFAIIYIFLGFYLYNLQLNRGNFYLDKAQAQQKAGGILTPLRGGIYFTDKNNNLIQAVLNKEYPVIYAVPSEIQKNNKDISQLAKLLSEITKNSSSDIEKQLNKKNDQYELLVQKASAEQVEKIKFLEAGGIYVRNQLLRFYQYGSMASHVFGFVSSAEENGESGKYGLELNFNKLLAGIVGQINGTEIVGSENGEDLILTIDRNIQSQAEEILDKLIKEYGASGGTVIVQDPKTGKILAMGSFPNFDPNSYFDYEIKTFLNPAVQAVYEPGSVFKIITMAAGIDSGKITPETKYIDTGSVTFNGKTLQNWDLKAHGEQTMTGVIEQSINTGSVFAQRQIGPQLFYNYLIKFGLSELTDISLPGEVRGNLNNLKKGKDVDFATASFGQGVAITPIELINAVSVLANGGKLMKPIILADEKPEIVKQVISSQVAESVSKMMVSAVEKNVLAAIKNYSVAGKTGTAFVPDFNKGGYTEQVINTYVGFAPAYDARFVILIKLDKPAGSPLAGQTVVPAFRELAEFILNYYNIAPDKI